MNERELILAIVSIHITSHPFSGSENQMANEIHDEASNVTANKGNVHLKGPDGVDVAMTPDAAAETSDRLLAGAANATGQRLNKRRQEDERRTRTT